MTTALILRRHVLVQARVSVLINSVLSLLFGLAVSHGRSSMPLSGIGGMAFDFFPQTFMITFATVTAVTLATRAQVRRGALEAQAPLRWAPAHPALRAIVFAIPATAVLAPLAGLTLGAAGVQALETTPFLVSKVAYGIFLSLLMAPIASLTGRDPSVAKGLNVVSES